MKRRGEGTLKLMKNFLKDRENGLSLRDISRKYDRDIEYIRQKLLQEIADAAGVERDSLLDRPRKSIAKAKENNALDVAVTDELEDSEVGATVPDSSTLSEPDDAEVSAVSITEVPDNTEASETNETESLDTCSSIVSEDDSVSESDESVLIITPDNVFTNTRDKTLRVFNSIDEELEMLAGLIKSPAR